MPKRAFTLIELLVVIAIIAILAAILFPVFSQAKAAGKKAACISNTRQLSLGVLMYANDNDDQIPPTQTDNFVLWPDLVNPYVKNAKIRVCPSETGAGAVNSYGLNEMVFVDDTDYLPNPPPPSPTMTTFSTPADTVMMGDLGVGDDLITPRLNAYKMTIPDDDLNDQFDARPSARHFNQCNLAFFDGHARSLHLEKFYVNQTPPDKWFCIDPTNLSACSGGN